MVEVLPSALTVTVAVRNEPVPLAAAFIVTAELLVETVHQELSLEVAVIVPVAVTVTLWPVEVSPAPSK